MNDDDDDARPQNSLKCVCTAWKFLGSFELFHFRYLLNEIMFSCLKNIKWKKNLKMKKRTKKNHETEENIDKNAAFLLSHRTGGRFWY